MIFKNDGPAGELNGFVDAGSQLNGELRFDTSFRVEGRVEGTVVSEGVLVIGEGGEVEGDVRVAEIFVSGTLRGTIKASRKLQLCATGKLLADVETPSLAIEDGAVFEGRCSMNREAAGDRPGSAPGEAGGGDDTGTVHALPVSR